MEFSNLKVSNMFYNWEPCMGCSVPKVNKSIIGNHPPRGFFKFNVDGVTRGKPGRRCWGSS